MLPEEAFDVLCLDGCVEGRESRYITDPQAWVAESVQLWRYVVERCDNAGLEVYCYRGYDPHVGSIAPAAVLLHPHTSEHLEWRAELRRRRAHSKEKTAVQWLQKLSEAPRPTWDGDPETIAAALSSLHTHGVASARFVPDRLLPGWCATVGDLMARDSIHVVFGNLRPRADERGQHDEDYVYEGLQVLDQKTRRIPEEIAKDATWDGT